MDARTYGPVPTTPRNPIFGAATRAVVPLDLASHDYVEEEYFLSGRAHRYGAGLAVDGGPFPYTTRVLVRRPSEAPSGVTYVSVLNASQGYDIDDDWRRAWDWLIENRHTYVAVTLKPISIEALRTFNPTRYRDLSWQIDGRPHRFPVTAAQGWDPFQIVRGCEEGLAWDILVDVARWVRSPAFAPGGSRRVFLVGQSQSGTYVNTFAARIHRAKRRPDGGPWYDGYLAGVASVLTRPLQQVAHGQPTWRVGPVPDLDVPVLVVSCDGDLDLFTVSNADSPQAQGADRLPVPGPDPFAIGIGDGPLRRHYQVAGTPHSDARSPALAREDDIVRAGRQPAVRTQELVDRLNPVPLEPVITGALAALLRWVDDGVPAPPSVYFDRSELVPKLDEFGNLMGGLRLGLVAHPLATFHGASAENPTYGGLELFGSYDVRSRFPDLTAYLAACAEVDDALERAGYLEPVGRRLLRKVAAELWSRVVDGAPALWATPQGPEPRVR